MPNNHEDHITVKAWESACIIGECGHVDENGNENDSLELCPSVEFTVCIDCMDERGAGRMKEGWEEWSLSSWPHEKISNG